MYPSDTLNKPPLPIISSFKKVPNPIYVTTLLLLITYIRSRMIKGLENFNPNFNHLNFILLNHLLTHLSMRLIMFLFDRTHFSAKSLCHIFSAKYLSLRFSTKYFALRFSTKYLSLRISVKFWLTHICAKYSWKTSKSARLSNSSFNSFASSL